MTIPEICVETLAKALKDREYILLDVRTEEEHEVGNLPCVHIPLHQLMFKLDELDKNKPIAVICRAGGRSAQAVALLKEAGFENVVNVKGGFKAWCDKIDPSFKVG